MLALSKNVSEDERVFLLEARSRKRPGLYVQMVPEGSEQAELAELSSAKGAITAGKAD